MTGKVYLTGAGPGDIDLITVKGLNILKEADVIIYDSLIDKKLLDYAKNEAEKIFVGKRSGNHTLPQEEINRLLAVKAKEHRVVVRLKGGDPFVFGRGGEEALYLKQNNIEYEVIPGVTSAIAGAVYAGIPVTQRGIASSVQIISGHSLAGLNWQDYVHTEQTLVFLMGFSNLEIICSNLIRHGKSPETPVAVISNATCSNQKTVTGTLEDIYEKTSSLETPAIIVVGEVVNLRQTIRKNIIVTRAKHQNTRFMQKIESAGANPIELPTIEIQPLEVKLPPLEQYNWIIFTSSNAVDLFFPAGADQSACTNIKIAAIGESTAECLEKYHLKPDIVPDEFVSEAMVEELKANINKTDKVLFPKAEHTRGIITEELIKLGAQVDELVLYKTVIPEYNKEELDNIAKIADAVCFTSPSSVRNFPLASNIKAYCIGPVTAKAAKEAGFKEIYTADDYTIDGLMEKLQWTLYTDREG